MGIQFETINFEICIVFNDIPSRTFGKGFQRNNTTQTPQRNNTTQTPQRNNTTQTPQRNNTTQTPPSCDAG